MVVMPKNGPDLAIVHKFEYFLRVFSGMNFNFWTFQVSIYQASEVVIFDF